MKKKAVMTNQLLAECVAIGVVLWEQERNSVDGDIEWDSTRCIVELIMEFISAAKNLDAGGAVMVRQQIEDSIWHISKKMHPADAEEILKDYRSVALREPHYKFAMRIKDAMKVLYHEAPTSWHNYNLILVEYLQDATRIINEPLH